MQGTREFDTYVADMLWAQTYAMASRAQMMAAAQRSLFEVVGRGAVVKTIYCHHNSTQRERHLGRDVWVADQADQADLVEVTAVLRQVVNDKGT